METEKENKSKDADADADGKGFADRVGITAKSVQILVGTSSVGAPGSWFKVSAGRRK